MNHLWPERRWRHPAGTAAVDRGMGPPAAAAGRTGRAGRRGRAGNTDRAAVGTRAVAEGRTAGGRARNRARRLAAGRPYWAGGGVAGRCSAGPAPGYCGGGPIGERCAFGPVDGYWMWASAGGYCPSPVDGARAARGGWGVSRTICVFSASGSWPGLAAVPGRGVLGTTQVLSGSKSCDAPSATSRIFSTSSMFCPPLGSCSAHHITRRPMGSIAPICSHRTAAA